MKEHYELLYIIAAKQAVDDLEQVYKRVHEIIEEHDAVITHEQEFRRSRLAYPVQHVHQGIYILIEFDGEKEKVAKIEQELKHTPEVLRQMIIKRRILSDKELERERIYKAQMAKEHEARKRHWEEQQRREDGRSGGRGHRSYEKREEKRVLVQQPMEAVAAVEKDKEPRVVASVVPSPEAAVKESLPVKPLKKEEPISEKEAEKSEEKASMPPAPETKSEEKPQEKPADEKKDDSKKKIKQEKVALEDLDKKLDEILDDTLF